MSRRTCPPPLTVTDQTCSQLQMEEDSRNKGVQTETERLQARANQHTRNRAEGLLDEQRDEVKHMNQMVLYSKCVTIRWAGMVTSARQTRETRLVLCIATA